MKREEGLLLLPTVSDVLACIKLDNKRESNSSTQLCYSCIGDYFLSPAPLGDP